MPTLHWVGKEAVLNHHEEVPFHLLQADAALSVGDPDSGNLLVEGDNLLALKALLPYYAGKVKCIYIDPPYNTGNESWVYNDNVNSPDMRDWLGKVVGKEVEDLSRHDKWLCMMYPRLVLLRQFLRPDGSFWMSIDDNEVHHARMMLDDIFGGNNFVTQFIWRKVDSPNDNKVAITPDHEFVICYARDKSQATFKQKPDDSILGSYRGPDETGQMYRDRLLKKNGRDSLRKDREDMFFPIPDPDGNEIYPIHDDGRESRWSHGLKSVTRMLANDELVWKKRNTPLGLRWIPYTREYAPKKPTRPYPSIWYDLNTMRQAKALQTEIFRDGRGIDTPKPIDLIGRIIHISCDAEDLVLDSFSGSGTTGHAVLQANVEDGGTRRFILIEMEKEVAQPVTQQRIERVIDGYAFKGTERTELLREKLTVTNFKKSAKIVAEMDAIKKERKDEFDGFETKIANDHITFNGKRKIDGFKEGLGGGFRYCRLGETLFDATGSIRDSVTFAELARHVFFSETGSPLSGVPQSPLIGTFNGTAIYLLYNGILHDIQPDGGNVLTRALLATLPKHDGTKIIYANGCLIAPATLAAHHITFRQTPYEIKVS